ncbi:peptide/nickel transport system substrate-binding protein [Singulisphaera sp. GP187]|uniref:ABC transporter substrate-binding protein n=1 Tax=Singulisphaera sp. GP187 TaxID=1882752 RepID=UPI00092B99F4|nr:ABC transporter substrate-binding protein [Singulisphaera sp. GP187]SIN82413.1 peptide/nickel transport system substrate-binding protein [Singulisphaera sp. GP187]
MKIHQNIKTWLESIRNRRPGRVGSLGISTLLVVLGMGSLPVAVRGQNPSGGGAKPDLLRSLPFDRVTLIDGSILIVDPVSPRPLPAYDAEKERKQKQAFRPPAEGNIGLPGSKSKVVMPGAEEKAAEIASQVSLHLIEGEIRDFKVKRGSIKKVEYFEDLLLAEGDRWLLARNYAKAFECFLRVQSREPGWVGLDDRVNRLLFEEGNAALLDGDGERGLRLLRELFVRKPDYPELADKLAKAYGSRADRAFQLGLHALGRKILHDLEPLAPHHPVVTEVRERFISRARELTDQANRLNGPARLDALVEALRVWPKFEEASRAYPDAFASVPTLDVGVIDIPRPVGPWIHAPADARVTPLLYLPILTRDDDESAEGKRPGQLAAGLESTNLGRRIVIPVRQGVSWSDRSRSVSANDIARAFTDRTEPASPQYNARWADAIERVETPDPTRVELRLNRSLLKLNSWLLAPVGPAHGGWDGRVATGDQGRLLVSDGPFALASSAADEIQLLATDPSHSPGRPKPRRIREIRYADAPSALGALVRGEISLLEHVPADRIPALAATPDFKVGRYSAPSMHRIALDGRNPMLRNRALRRGLSYAINRRLLLEETLLKHPPDERNLASDGPFAKGTIADAPDVLPLGYDPLLAAMLVAAARKELEVGPIKLNLEYPSIPEAQAVVPKLVEALKLVGVTLVPIERRESELESELRAGRKFELAYRASRTDEPVLELGAYLCPGYDAPSAAGTLASVASPRILQLLLELERVSEWPSARALAIQIDRESRDELPVLPLWQLDDHYAWRTRLKGPTEASGKLYEGIESWEIEPWFAIDPW